MSNVVASNFMSLRDTIQALIDEGYQLKVNEQNRVPFRISRERYEYDIRDVELPSRIYKAAVRNGITKVGEVIDFLANADPTKLESVGAKTIRDGKRRLLEWQWEDMSDREKAGYIKELFV